MRYYRNTTCSAIILHSNHDRDNLETTTQDFYNLTMINITDFKIINVMALFSNIIIIKCEI